MSTNIKEKILGGAASMSGTLSFLGSYQVCHNACLALISILTILGFTVAGMPLLFLTGLAVPFWTMALALLFTTVILKYGKNMEFSGKVILLNSGLIIAGIPFENLQKFSHIFWIIGGSLAAFSVGLYIYEKLEKK